MDPARIDTVGAHTVRVRPDLADLPAYKAGQRPAARTDGLAAFKISSNENPYPPLPGVLEAIARAAADTHRYPDVTNRELTEALGGRFDVEPDHIAVGTGSVAVCGQLVASTSGPGDEVLFGWRSFEAYPIWVQIAHATSVMVPLNDRFELDLEAMADEVNESTSLVFICSPNNPTGTGVSHAAVEAFLDRVPDTVPVVIDEAYVEYVRDPEIVDGLRLHRERSNVAVLRTFSKAYGLAALRVGFVIAPPALADSVRRTATPFGVSTIASAAAIASLDAEAQLLERVDAVVAERERVTVALSNQGWQFPASQANFLWLPLGERAVEFATYAESHALTVRPFVGEGVRVTIAETEANDRFIEVAGTYLESTA